VKALLGGGHRAAPFQGKKVERRVVGLGRARKGVRNRARCGG
jgi:hypothetical protein